MNKTLLTLAFLATISFGRAQTDTLAIDTSWKTLYRAVPEKINDLVHTKLDAKFDYNKSQLIGKAWLTLQPHFDPVNTLVLDAKGMDIKQVALVKSSGNQTLKYKYDGWLLTITLDKTYKRNEKYSVFIDYIAKPNDLKAKGSEAIKDAKGLYFINPKGEEKNKPTQIWTQGETEGTSVWLPIIDKPNQKCTEEITMTVPDKYVTLSNGKLVSQKKNPDGTRTDSWKMDLPHSPYLFFMGVGDYAVIKDKYKNIDVDYYVEKEYAGVAKKIFGLTPQMIAYFEKLTGVPYPWNKYAQITGKDYVSGAMENTTSTLHSDAAQADARELVDGNEWETTIAHELFHQWFGDYVTAKSWSNLTVNESFADYSEYLWLEHQYGLDKAGEDNIDQMEAYTGSAAQEEKHLVRYYYADKEDMFDLVSYQKGGRVLHMLRKAVGDSAFFKALNLYLNTNKFSNADAGQLRLAMETVSGKDLNWFFNQWYYGSGHPKLDISYKYDDAAKKAIVTINQTQDGNVFKLPIAIDVYNGSTKQRREVWLQNKVDTFVFPYKTKPDLINVDAEKYTLCEKNDHKTLENYTFQYKNAQNYADRREALAASIRMQQQINAMALMESGLHDPYAGLRKMVLDSLDFRNQTVQKSFEPAIAELAKSEKNPKVKGKALELLGYYKNSNYLGVFKNNLGDSSYSVAGAALFSYTILDQSGGLAAAKEMVAQPSKGKLAESICIILMSLAGEEEFDNIAKTYSVLSGQEKLDAIDAFASFLVRTQNTEKVKQGVDLITDYRDHMAARNKDEIIPIINNVILKGIATQKAATKSGSSNAVEIQKQIDYINEKIQK